MTLPFPEPRASARAACATPDTPTRSTPNRLKHTVTDIRRTPRSVLVNELKCQNVPAVTAPASPPRTWRNRLRPRHRRRRTASSRSPPPPARPARRHRTDHPRRSTSVPATARKSASVIRCPPVPRQTAFAFPDTSRGTPPHAGPSGPSTYTAAQSSLLSASTSVVTRAGVFTTTCARAFSHACSVSTRPLVTITITGNGLSLTSRSRHSYSA